MCVCVCVSVHVVGRRGTMACKLRRKILVEFILKPKFGKRCVEHVKAAVESNAHLNLIYVRNTRCTASQSLSHLILQKLTTTECKYLLFSKRNHKCISHSEPISSFLVWRTDYVHVFNIPRKISYSCRQICIKHADTVCFRFC